MQPPELIPARLVPITELAPNKGQIPKVKRNPRLIRDGRYKLLLKSIREDPEMLGLREILAYPYGGKLVIIGGNMRYHALKELGYEQVAVKELPAAMTPAKLNAIIIKDNSAFGEWDWDALANDGWEAQDLADWAVDIPEQTVPKEEESAQEDDYNPTDDLAKKAKTRPGDVYALGRHRLICGDSTDPDVIRALCSQEAVDMVLTDPPYNVNYSSKNDDLRKAKQCHGEYNGYKYIDIKGDNMAPAAFREFLTTAFRAADTVLKPGGAVYVWHASMQGDNFISAYRAAGWEWKQTLVWVKNCMVIGRQDYQWNHELCLYGWKPGAAHYFTDSRAQLTAWMERTMPKKKDGSWDFNACPKSDLVSLIEKIEELPTTVIHENKPLRSADHPTMKPVRLMGRCIKNSTRQGETVLDPFLGSGSTLIAAEQLGRVCFGVELEPIYCDVIVKRWEEYTQEKAELIGNIADGAEQRE